MTTIEKIYWLPVWLIMFSLIFATGAYYYNQSMLTHVADEYLRAAANKGRFVTLDIENLMEELDKNGFKKENLKIEISPAKALNEGVSKESDEYIELEIKTNRIALISRVYDILIPGDNKIEYSYKRIAKSEEYFD